MKALSIWPEYAMAIITGKKVIEYRTWSTNHRGDLLICSTKAHGIDGTIPAHAIGVVEVDKVTKSDYYDEYEWHLKNPRPIKPVPVRGKQGLYSVDIDLEFAPEKGFDNYDAWMLENFWSKSQGAEKDKEGNWNIKGSFYSSPKRSRKPEKAKEVSNRNKQRKRKHWMN